jgi:hypothetical protein
MADAQGKSNKPKGWFSRKHQDNAAHSEAVQKYGKAHSKLARAEKAQANAAKRTERSAAQQLKLLDERLGENVGAAKERARLQKLVNPEQ